MKKYYLGIDGGGTKTAFCLIDDNLKVCETIISGPTSIDTVDEQSIKSNLEKALKQISIDGKIVSCFAGIGGITSREDEEKIIQILKSFSVLKDAKIKAGNDVINALIGGIGKEEGIVCIIGTGSVCFGVHNGKTHRCGGYCYQEGDAGSSYDLGKKALQHLARVFDKRANASLFSEKIAELSNTFGFTSLVNYFISASRTEIASLAKVVTKYSDNEEAKKIIDNGVDEIILMIKTVYQELNFETAELAIIGSLGNADTYYRTKLIQELNKQLPNIKLITNRFDAHYGAALKAYHFK